MLLLRGLQFEAKLNKMRNSFTAKISIVFILLFVVFLHPFQIYGIDYQLTKGKASIKGRVIDSNEKKPLEFANIVLYHLPDSDQVAGTISDEKGEFLFASLPADDYYLGVTFVGFVEYYSATIRILDKKEQVDLGSLFLQKIDVDLEDVEVTAERTNVVYKIDKKIVNVGADLANTGGSAVDALENVPSVQVDVEGNVSLRGSTDFIVLIDGRQSIFDASTALKQIPVGTIDNIEIITNPSAKYQSEGTSGIINVVTKRKQAAGSSGIFNLKPSSFNSLSGDFTYNLRNEKFSFYMGANYGYSRMEGHTQNYIEINRNDTLHILSANGERPEDSWPAGIDLGLELHLNPKNILSVGAYKGWYTLKRYEDLVSDSWLDVSPDSISSIRNWNDVNRNRDYYSVYGDFTHKFERKGSQINFSYLYKEGNAEEESLSETYNPNGEIGSGRLTTESTQISFWRFKSDYKLPLKDDYYIESGYYIGNNHELEGSGFREYNSQVQDYVLSPFSNSTNNKQIIQSLYIQGGGSLKNFGYQLGLRSEYTDTKFLHETTNQPYTTKLLDFFPNVHLSYQLPKRQQVMFSYSRRITRPSSGKLEPFESWLTMNFVKIGNPDLKPEYSGSYELSWFRYFKDNWISFETFLRNTSNDITAVEQQYNDSVLLLTYTNFGRKYSLGAEFSLDWKLTKFWNINVLSDYYYFHQVGEDLDLSRSQQEYSWDFKVRNNFRFWKNNRLQLGTGYIGPSYIAQGYHEGYLLAFLVMRQTFFKNKLSLTLRLHDFLKTGKFVYYREGQGFYNRNEFVRTAPTYYLTITYNFNKLRKPRKVADMYLKDIEN